MVKMNKSLQAITMCVVLLINLKDIYGKTFTASPSVLSSSSNNYNPSVNKILKKCTPSDTVLLVAGNYSTGTTDSLLIFDGDQLSNGKTSDSPTMVICTSGVARIKGQIQFGTRSFKSRFICFENITFDGSVGLYNTEHIVFKNCGFRGVNTSAFGIGTNDHDFGNSDNLIQDCYIWSINARICAINYRSDRNIWRRVLISGTGCSAPSCIGSGNPNVGFSVYESRDCSIQNVIVIDRLLDKGSPYADFATAQHNDNAYFLQHCEWLGCMSINAPDCGFYFESDNSQEPTILLQNCVAWNSHGPGFNVASNIASIDVENCTSGFSFHDGFRIRDVKNGILVNLLVTNAGRFGLNTHLPSEFINIYKSKEDSYNDKKCVKGCYAFPPHTSGLLHITGPTEDGALATKGKNNSFLGAVVRKRYGKDNTFFGDSGYNELSAIELWPYPNEKRIKLEMSKDITHGFFGGNQSLTEFINSISTSKAP
jgi:hypothetical protein